MKDGRTHLAHKAENAVDLDTGATVGVTVQDADDGDAETSIETLITAAEQIEAMLAKGDGLQEVVANRTDFIERRVNTKIQWPRGSWLPTFAARQKLASRVTWDDGLLEQFRNVLP